MGTTSQTHTLSALIPCACYLDFWLTQYLFICTLFYLYLPTAVTIFVPERGFQKCTSHALHSVRAYDSLKQPAASLFDT